MVRLRSKFNARVSVTVSVDLGLHCTIRKPETFVWGSAAESVQQLPSPASEVNPNILSTTGLKFEGLVFATAGSSCIAILGRRLDVGAGSVSGTVVKSRQGQERFTCRLA